MGKKSGIIVIDEYGDGIPVKQEVKEGKWREYLDPENQSLLNLDQWILSLLYHWIPPSSLLILS